MAASQTRNWYSTRCTSSHRTGRNEAGKTTILNAIADLLFGFGARTDYDFQHDGKFLRIGATLRLADGRELKLRRRKGNKNTLIDEN